MSFADFALHRWFSTILSDFCIHGVSKAAPGTTKITSFYVVSQVGRRALFTIARPSFVFFCGDFVLNFRRFWYIFSSIAWAKQHRERKQLMRFDAFSQVKRRHAFLIIAISIFTIFRGHFAVILDAFWCNFARFWIPVRKPDLRLRMNLGARQNASFLSIFEAFLTLQKSSSPHCFADFLKNKYKTWSRKSESFLGHLYMDIVFFELFTRPRKKHDMRDDWWVWNIKLRGSASTQKWSKNDASLSVDGFGGVRNGDRIRASGDVLFFHIVK